MVAETPRQDMKMAEVNGMELLAWGRGSEGMVTYSRGSRPTAVTEGKKHLAVYPRFQF